ncbi:MAG: M48 family metalloprotease [Desulfobacterales bacterium]|nr:M48 family metalloprotease [Desulfobacterales bacterium]
MKRLSGLFILFFLLTGCEDTNVRLATEAGIDAVRAVTLSDGDVRILARQAAGEADRQHRIAGPGSHYGRRLERLIQGIRTNGDIQYNIKVYLADQINAFAMADGTIRIYSGLMDRMDDGELLFVIGHEMGHVAENHTKKKLIMAYAASALRKGIASQENTAGQIAGSALGAFVQALANARFSQQEEQAADDYGVAFLKLNRFPDPAGTAAGALEKLARASNSHSLLSSHPAPDKRSERIRRSEKNRDEKEGSLPDSLAAKGISWYEWVENKLRDIFSNNESENK